ncbi:TPA: DUF262 domain-containing protein [Vibrio parahaemolyticus]|uniref:HNH endonuclease family protein n=1 Tax=Vibrio TaxID=662 RepID=UPI0002D83928|nr:MULTISPECIES: DUF262 domain-containing protein [Vibrio]EGR2252106.1 DUF262 domain-containing protein [Vibrio parahaemolyticus]EIW7482269.1 DUF262 domain-containing protein [Vibrio parahaemolyticus]EJG2181470.1 DUF262 domain-containing protein [Vibrio parahaemolyticus]EKZ9250436.1 DUF262 domain-containing protein [Vibrio parahaemolyticus]ELA6679626.1 DUF262 domain-containing protein [Vibrio parahaemolyticus]
MEIELKKIKVRELFQGYSNRQEAGVVAFNGMLNVRPAYQREFVYKDKQRDAVIDTVIKGFPLNTMYWVDNEDGTFEVLDGQQRTISICEYVDGKFSIDYQYFFNLENDEKEEILNYELMVYFCKGSDREKLDWFKIINIAGEKLTNQELRNAIYTGTWLTSAKKFFSKTGCPANTIGSDYMKGSTIRQEYLETVLDWASGDLEIEEYMAQKQHDPNANKLWSYFNSIIDWVKLTFPNYRKEMKGVAWGPLYDEFKDETLDSDKIEAEITQLLQDEDVTKKSGVFTFVLTRDERVLNIRQFNEKMRREAYERQGGICAITGEAHPFEDMDADHIIPWSKGGKTTADNCQMVHKLANQMKSNK